MANSIPKDDCNVLSPLHVLFHNVTLTLFPLKCGFYVSSTWFWVGFDYSRSNSKWILKIGDIKWYQWYKPPLLFFPWELSHRMWRSSNSLTVKVLVGRNYGLWPSALGGLPVDSQPSELASCQRALLKAHPLAPGEPSQLPLHGAKMNHPCWSLPTTQMCEQNKC